MTSLKLECLTTDGTYLYGFSQPYYGSINNTGNGSAFALIRSNPNPTSATSLTWTLLNAIDAGGHIFLGDQQYCTIDDKGVFSVFSPESYERGQHYLSGLGPKGIRFTPGGPNPKSDTQGSMSGTWKNFNLTGYEQHRWEAHITNAVFNHKDSTGVNTLMHAAVNKSSSEDIRLSAMNPQETELTQGQQSFKLDPNTSGSRYVSLGFANGNLHVFGQHWRTDGQGQVLAMTIIPITSTSTYIPTNSMYTTLNATLIYSRCASTSGYQNANLGKDLVINCWSVSDEQAYFFHYDGTSIRELGSSENAGIYEIMTMVPVGKSTSFEIFMLFNSATTVISSVRLINDGTPRRNITKTSTTSITIPDRFTMTPSSTPNNSGSSDGGGGLGVGAIIGILAALLIALGGFVVWVRRRKVSAQNAAATSQTQIRPHKQESEPAYEVKTYIATGPDGQHPATSIQGGPTLLAGQISFAQQQQTYPANSLQQQQAHPPQPQPYQPPQQQFVFSTHPRPTVASVMDPDNPILQQQPQPQPQPQHDSQVSQGWQPQPFVPPHQVPIPQEAPSSSPSSDTLNRPLPSIPPRP